MKIERIMYKEKTNHYDMRLQFVSLSQHCLTLRTSIVNDSVTFGTMMAFFSFIFSLVAMVVICHIFSTMNPDGIFYAIFDSFLVLLLPLFLILLTRRYIYNITLNSDVVLNRNTKKIYFYSNGNEYICDLSCIELLGGLKTTHLIIYTCDSDDVKTEHKIEFDTHWNFTFIVSYINSFVNKGSSEVLIPERYDWDDVKQKKIYLKPMEIISHYKPWPFCSWPCDEGERTMKIYLWPLYLVFFFPLFVISSFIWWGICWYGKVQIHPVPKDSYESDNSVQVTPEWPS